jgi:hypothetical protein
MHRRDGAKVAVAMNVTNVAPAGEFQPHSDVLPVWRADLNMWHNVMREYAEELLGLPESMGQGGTVINYQAMIHSAGSQTPHATATSRSGSSASESIR